MDLSPMETIDRRVGLPLS